MGYRLTGLNGPFFGLSWEKTDGDKKTARSVVTFLEDRRLLFGDRHVEDEHHCVRSALAIRKFLTEQIDQAKPGKQLEASLKAMRAACRKFVEAGGPDGRDFARHDRHYVTADPFGLALGDLRTSIGYQLSIILSQYPMKVEQDLARILPAADEPVDRPLSIGRWDPDSEF